MTTYIRTTIDDPEALTVGPSAVDGDRVLISFDDMHVVIVLNDRAAYALQAKLADHFTLNPFPVASEV